MCQMWIMAGLREARNHATGFGGTAGSAKHAEVGQIAAENAERTDRALVLPCVFVSLHDPLASDVGAWIW